MPFCKGISDNSYFALKTRRKRKSLHKVNKQGSFVVRIRAKFCNETFDASLVDITKERAMGIGT